MRAAMPLLDLFFFCVMVFIAGHTVESAVTSHRARALPFTGQPSKAYHFPRSFWRAFWDQQPGLSNGLGRKDRQAKLQWVMHTDVLSAYTVNASPQGVRGGPDCLSSGTESLDHLPLHLQLTHKSKMPTPLNFHFVNIGGLFLGKLAMLEFGVDRPGVQMLANAMARALDFCCGKSTTETAVATLATAVLAAFHGDSTFDFTYDAGGGIKSLGKGLPPATFDERLEIPGELAVLLNIGNTYDTGDHATAADMLVEHMQTTGVNYAADKQALYVHILRNATFVVHWETTHTLLSSACAIESFTKYDRRSAVVSMLIEADDTDAVCREKVDTHFHSAALNDRASGEFSDDCKQTMLFGDLANDHIELSLAGLIAAFHRANVGLSQAEIVDCKAFRVSASIVTAEDVKYIVFSGHFKWPKQPEWPHTLAAVVQTWFAALKEIEPNATIIMGMDTNLQTLADVSTTQGVLRNHNLVMFNTAAVDVAPPTPPLSYIPLVIWMLVVLVFVSFL